MNCSVMLAVNNNNMNFEKELPKFKKPGEDVIPEEVKVKLENISDEIFWTPENLRKEFENDITFGVKMWGGLLSLLESENLQISPEIRSEFDKLADIIISDKIYNPRQQTEALLRLREWMKSQGFNLSHLSAKEIIKMAYLGEAEVMQKVGIDPLKNPPFSFSIGLNKEHPIVKEVLKKEWGDKTKRGEEILERACKESPSLKAKLEEFEEWIRPPDNR